MTHLNDVIIIFVMMAYNLHDTSSVTEWPPEEKTLTSVWHEVAKNLWLQHNSPLRNNKNALFLDT